MSPRTRNWAAVQRYYDNISDPVECQRAFGITYSAWRMAVARGKLRVIGQNADRRKRHDWRLVQAYYDDGHSFYECMLAFKFSRGAWHKAMRRGDIRTRPAGRAIEELLSTGKSRQNLKLRLLRCGLLENRCAECGLTEWRGKPLAIQIDHVNGVRDDHRLENLRMLCPNCHSQTETYGRKRRQARNEHPQEVLQDSAAPV